MSCDSNWTAKLNRLGGTWKLSRMEYIDGQGVQKIVTSSNTKIVLADHFPEGETVDGERKGKQLIGNESYEFSYNFGLFEPKSCNFFFDEVVKMQLPIDAIGRIQVYDFEQADKRHIRFFTDLEYDYAAKEKLRKVSYFFEKLD